MSLLEAIAQPVEVLKRASVPDGEGGTTDTWTVSETISAAASRTAASVSTEGGKPTQTGSWTLLLPYGTQLAMHDVLRLKDGTTLRVVETPQDAPSTSAIRRSMCVAEEWRLS